MISSIDDVSNASAYDIQVQALTGGLKVDLLIEKPSLEMLNSLRGYSANVERWKRALELNIHKPSPERRAEYLLAWARIDRKFKDRPSLNEADRNIRDMLASILRESNDDAFKLSKNPNTNIAQVKESLQGYVVRLGELTDLEGFEECSNLVSTYARGWENAFSPRAAMRQASEFYNQLIKRITGLAEVMNHEGVDARQKRTIELFALASGITSSYALSKAGLLVENDLYFSNINGSRKVYGEIVSSFKPPEKRERPSSLSYVQAPMARRDPQETPEQRRERKQRLKRRRPFESR